MRTLLKDVIYDKKLATNGSREDTSDILHKTFEVINSEDFFTHLKNVALTDNQKYCIIQVAGKEAENEQPYFLYQDMEEIFKAYGLVDDTKPTSTKNLQFD